MQGIKWDAGTQVYARSHTLTIDIDQSGCVHCPICGTSYDVSQAIWRDCTHTGAGHTPRECMDEYSYSIRKVHCSHIKMIKIWRNADTQVEFYATWDETHEYTQKRNQDEKAKRDVAKSLATYRKVD